MHRDEGMVPQRAVGLRTGVTRVLAVQNSEWKVNHLSPKSLI